MDFKTLFKGIYDVAGIFILWIWLHYVASNMYPKFCTELSFIGFIKSIFLTQSPHCVAMRWVIYNGGNVINSMWISVGIWISAKIFTNLFITKSV
jgi:hypothetical protein